jgi:hypothetical protein
VVQAAGNTGRITYSYNDSAINTLLSQPVYYRLQIVDANGASRYSNVIILSVNKTRGTIIIHPNPVINEATVEINTVVAGKINYELTDITGKKILQHAVTLAKGDNTITIHLDKLPAGIYYLKVSGNNINEAVKLQKL